VPDRAPVVTGASGTFSASTTNRAARANRRIHPTTGGFSLVHRLNLVGDDGARGSCVFPVSGEIPATLAAEAIGQLAAWVVMARAGFHLRPLPGLIGLVELAGAAPAGRTIELEAGIEPFEVAPAAPVVVHGRARIGDRVFVELRDCVSILLASEELDDPRRLADEFAQLGEPGRLPPAVALDDPVLAIEPVLLEVRRAEPPQLRAELLVPEQSRILDDHFPRKPVLPASVLLDRLVRLAAVLASETADDEAPGEGRHAPRSGDAPIRAGADDRAVVRDVKLRSFAPAGARLVLAVEAQIGRRGSFATRALLDGRSIASATIALTTRAAP